MKRILFLFMVFMFFAAFTCNEDDNTVSGKGTVIHFNLEGGFYGIVTDNGGHYLPENLGADFQQDSLRVYFEGVLTNKVTIQQWGNTIRLTKIQRIQ